MYKVELFIKKTPYSLGYLYYRGKNLCFGGNEKEAIFFTDESFKNVKLKIDKDYKISKKYEK